MQIFSTGRTQSHIPVVTTHFLCNSFALSSIAAPQNNEKVVLVVARRKQNFASSQSTAITGQRETDGAVPAPQSSLKVKPRFRSKQSLVFDILLFGS